MEPGVASVAMRSPCGEYLAALTVKPPWSSVCTRRLRVSMSQMEAPVKALVIPEADELTRVGQEIDSEDAVVVLPDSRARRPFRMSLRPTQSRRSHLSPLRSICTSLDTAGHCQWTSTTAIVSISLPSSNSPHSNPIVFTGQEILAIRCKYLYVAATFHFAELGTLFSNGQHTFHFPVRTGYCPKRGHHDTMSQSNGGSRETNCASYAFSTHCPVFGACSRGPRFHRGIAPGHRRDDMHRNNYLRGRPTVLPHPSTPDTCSMNSR